MRVLIVDNSVVFRSAIRRALESIAGVEVVGAASNGRIALQMVGQRDLDLVTLDLNMPEPGGLAMLEQLRATRPDLRVLVFATHTPTSAEETIRALRLGADDFVLKPDGANDLGLMPWERIAKELTPRIRQFMQASKPVVTPPKQQAQAPRSFDPSLPSLVVVAASTGGPAALEVFLSCLQQPLLAPIVIVQHMPETFTAHLAARLAVAIGLNCREAIEGDELRAGTVLIVPGNYHARLVGSVARPIIVLDQGPRINGVRPAADPLFESAAAVMGSRCLAFVLTGMGSDGCAGAESLRRAGSKVVIQDQESSAVWGMPGAVHRAGAYDRMASLKDCAQILAQACNGAKRTP